MKNFTLFIFIFFFIGCATIGTKTIYKTKVQPTIQKIGYCTLSNIDTLSLICSETAQVFDSTINKLLNTYSLDVPLKLEAINNDVIKKDEISKICKHNNLEALLITDLRFKYMTYMVLHVPVASNYDTDVKMQLYDKHGELLYVTKHNTYKGNSYMKAPTAERTICDGVKGAFTRIAKEIGWKPQTK